MKVGNAYLLLKNYSPNKSRICETQYSAPHFTLGALLHLIIAFNTEIDMSVGKWEMGK